MSFKAVLKPDAIGVNKYRMAIAGLIELVVTSISNIEEEMDSVDLPDRTRVTGGMSKALEFTFMTPMHHTLEHIGLEAWFAEGKDPVSSTYKKLVTLQMISPTGNIQRVYAISGGWLSKRKLPQLEMENEGEMAQIEWTMSADSCTPIS